MRTERIS